MQIISSNTGNYAKTLKGRRNDRSTRAHELYIWTDLALVLLHNEQNFYFIAAIKSNKWNKVRVSSKMRRKIVLRFAVTSKSWLH